MMKSLLYITPISTEEGVIEKVEMLINQIVITHIV